MKNRKRIVVAFLCVAVLLLGVGYAAFTDTLTIIGNIVADMKQAEVNYDANVYFSDVKFLLTGTNSGDKSQDTVGGIGTDDATFAIHSLAVLGEYAEVEFTIANDSNVTVYVTMPATRLSGGVNNSNTNPDHFSIKYSHNGEAIDFESEPIEIPSKGTITVVAKVTVEHPITAATGATFGLDLNVSTTDETESETADDETESQTEAETN